MKQCLIMAIVLILFSSIRTLAQNRSITGTVLSAENNSALPGVNIRIKGTTKGTFTDIDGKYRIQASEDMVLIFSFVGFHPVEVPVANQSIIDVVMETDARILSEILVVGYGNINRRDLTGSVAQISEQTIQDIPAIGIDQAMQGRMAGVQINQNSGIRVQQFQLGSGALPPFLPATGLYLSLMESPCLRAVLPSLIMVVSP
ncbi:carboxypeptidase-like regulatory domain-containing protein [Echinicola jeungdonensis]|uniref:carboxypeptidase-like regulatory domain-containing protein n=1 Tax=Echinicola jeungdonensis TaxID=709343 RepID=UPI0025B3FE17|nr:carboxypeptidase-like regulatory domain-containing protein [Echinicola jeungdonensis]MDN3671218.1 carboxypeptidase-like regulatory domain-containing protein [Echinicola jeungdonensis]